MFQSSNFKFWKWHPVFKTIQQNYLRRVVLFLVVEHAPRCARAVVRCALGLVRRIPALDYVLTVWWCIAWPDAPVLSGNDC